MKKGKIQRRNERFTEDQIEALRFKSLNMPEIPEIIRLPLDNLLTPLPNHSWVNYPLGCIAQYIKRGYKLEQGYDILMWGNVPEGAGLSSSAAIEVVTACAFNDIFNAGYDRTELAKIGQLSEHDAPSTEQVTSSPNVTLCIPSSII